MKYIKIGDKQVSRVGLGSVNFGGTCPEAQAHEFLSAFYEKGGNFIDTARVYGDFKASNNGVSEKVIGSWLSKNHIRDNIFLSTKGAHPALGDMAHPRLSHDEILGDMCFSLEDLQTDCVDIYWLHRDNALLPVGGIMETLTELTEKGYTKYVGASNWSAERIEEANEYAIKHSLTPFYANQPQFSLAIQFGSDDKTLVTCDDKTIALHDKTNMLMTPFSSQAKGYFGKLDALGEAGLSDKIKRRFHFKENIEIYERLKKLSLELDRSVTALALNWLMSQPFPLIPLTSISNIGQLEDIVLAGDTFITSEQRDYIRNIRG